MDDERITPSDIPYVIRTEIEPRSIRHAHGLAPVPMCTAIQIGFDLETADGAVVTGVLDRINRFVYEMQKELAGE